MPELPITLVDYAEPEKYKDATTDFVMFVHKDRQLNSNDSKLFQVYKSNPSFRKLSMVAPATVVGDQNIYGYVHGPLGWEPKYTPSSQEPYAIQAGNITNAIIRKSALERIDFNFYPDDELVDSINLSLALWSAGLRIYINPNVIVKAPEHMDFGLGTVIDETTKKLFKREMIG